MTISFKDPYFYLEITASNYGRTHSILGLHKITGQDKLIHNHNQTVLKKPDYVVSNFNRIHLSFQSSVWFRNRLNDGKSVTKFVTDWKNRVAFIINFEVELFLQYNLSSMVVNLAFICICYFSPLRKHVIIYLLLLLPHVLKRSCM